MLKTHLLTKDLSTPLSEDDQELVSTFINLIYDEVVDNIASNRMTSDISIINTQINRGVIFHAKKMPQSTEMWIALLRSSVQVLLGNGYSLDHGYVSKSIEAEPSVSRHYVYIKPSLRLRAQVPVKQLFGNLFFDLTIEDNQAIQWQLLSNVYRGRNYQEPLELQDLIQAMWGNK